MTYLRVTDLTSGERLEVARRRAGLSQVGMARLLSRKLRRPIGRRTTQRWENDEQPGAPVVALGHLQPHEELYLLRRRAGLSRVDLAALVGVSKSWLTNMERGRVCAERLHTYWRAEHADRRRRDR